MSIKLSNSDKPDHYSTFQSSQGKKHAHHTQVPQFWNPKQNGRLNQRGARQL